MSVPQTALVTDYYQLTMMQGYWQSGLYRHIACFDMFIRKNPFEGGFTLTSGLADVLEYLDTLRFTDGDIAHLASLGDFDHGFLEYLRTLKFTGDLDAVPEGSVIFPHEPALRVIAPLDQCQLIESALLNIINFQSLIATKSARICLEAGYDNVLEFGLRRAQGLDGALSASRAAYIGGCYATSNVHAGQVYGIPAKGTHAHSWVTAFENEITAFRKFAEIYPDNSILLVDTYNTLQSGVPSAIAVGLEMKRKGQKLTGIRIDSGDLAFLSIEARKMLDAAGLVDTKIVCSSELDEYIIHDLNSQGAKIDIYGVGTKLISADGDPSLSGVYKMSALKGQGGEWSLKLKNSEGLKKATFPGLKQVWRMYDENNGMSADLVELEESEPDFTKGVVGVHPTMETEKKLYKDISSTEKLLQPVMRGGKIVAKQPALGEIRERAQRQLQKVHPTMRRLLNPHVYKVSVGPALYEATKTLRDSL